MKVSKLITAVVLFCIVSFSLLYGVPKIIPTEMAEAYAEFATPTLAYGLAVVLSGGYLVLSYRKAYSPSEIPQKKYEFYYATFDEEQKKILDAMTEEDKCRFVDEYEKVASDEKKQALNNNLFDWTHGFIPKGLKPVRTVVKLLVVGCVAWTGFAAYQQLAPSFEVYTANATKTLEDQTLYIEGLPPIVLVGDGTIRQSEVDMFVEKFKKLPESVRNAHSTIYLYSPKKYSDIEISANVGGTNVPAAGFAQGCDMHVPTSVSDKTLFHEATHVFDYNYGWLSDSSEFQTIFQNNKNNINFEYNSVYYKGDSKEFFAETGSMFILDSKNLKQQSESVYNYFARLYV